LAYGIRRKVEDKKAPYGRLKGQSGKRVEGATAGKTDRERKSAFPAPGRSIFEFDIQVL